MLVTAVASLGIVLPESVLQSEVFDVLAAFVALNTLMYTALAIAKILPKVYLGDWLHGHNRRSQSRSIHPDRGGIS